jgi:hypothetical protein
MMRIDEIACENDVLTVRCSGVFGAGSEGNPSTALLRDSIKSWLQEHRGNPLAEIELDLSNVEYVWGDGPVSSMLPFVAAGVSRVRIISSPDNRDALQNLIEESNVPWFELTTVMPN